MACHSIVEVLTNIFWLCTWAVLASEASAFDAEVRTINDLFDAFTSSESNSPFSSAVRNVRTAINCIKAAAALGALLWVLFIVSTVFLAMAVVAHYKATDGGGLGLKGRPRIGRPMEMNTVSAGAAGQPVEVPGAQPPAAGYYAPQQNQQYQHQQQPPPQQPQQPYSSA